MSVPFGRSQLARALGGAAVVLAGIVALEFLFYGGPVETGPVEGGTAGLPPLEELPPWVAPTFESYSEVLERPLFYEDRKLPPPPAVEAVAEAPREPLALVLEGVAISGESRVALLRDPRSNELVQVAPGETRNGWTLDSIDGGRAVFRRGDEITELLIEVAPTPGQAQPARRRPR